MMIPLFLAALFAQPAPPERVAIVAREAHPSPAQAALRVVRRAARRLVEESDPEVAAGAGLLLGGDADGALGKFDSAEHRLGPVPRLELDRAAALFAQGKAEEAGRAAAQALASGDAGERADAFYAQGLAEEGQGKPDEALRSYAQALALRPDDEDAKVNLELLLRGDERKKPSPGAQNETPSPPKAGERAPPKPAPGEEKKPGQSPDASGSAQAQAGPQKAPQEAPKPAAPKGEPPGRAVDRTEAARLLDALRASEKNLQSWRFSPEKRKEAKRSEAERDW